MILLPRFGALLKACKFGSYSVNVTVTVKNFSVRCPLRPPVRLTYIKDIFLEVPLVFCH